jgi:thioesterase domain-containing protein/acyl carrier protein
VIWGQILGAEPKNIKNNFFTSGGNSLSALRLILAVEKQFSVQISVNDLFAVPTLEKLSDKIQQLQTNALIIHSKTIDYKNQALPFPVIPLQTLGSKKPLFIIHPIGGTIFWFVDLARHLGKERPVYGIQDPGVQDLCTRDQEKIFSSLEEMAIFYLHCIRQIQPQGPYLIAGASFGATVAFEIARQLEKQGESADFVGLLDGWAFYPEATRDQKKFKKLMRNQCEELYQRFQINQLENADRWVNLQWQRSELLWAYLLQPLNTPLTLFKAEELNYAIEWEERDDNYWSNYSHKKLTIIPVPGNHTTIFSEPNVQYLAEKINACLEQTDLN